MKRHTSDAGFGAVEILLILLIVCLIGFFGWYIHSKKPASGTVKTTATTAKTPTTSAKTTTTAPAKVDTAAVYTGWKTGFLKYEQISYRYPSNWTILDQSFASTLKQGCVTPGSDEVTLTSPSNHEVYMRTGIDCIGDGGASPFGYVAANALGQTSYLVTENTPAQLDPGATGPAYACLATTTNPDVIFYGNSKHITGNGSTPVNQFCYYPYSYSTDAAAHVTTAAALEASADFKTTVLIFESMLYQ